MKISSGKIAGLLITVSAHLAVIIVLLLAVVNPRMQRELNRIEIDFSEQEKLEQLEKQLAKSKAINEKLERMLREAGIESPSVSDLKNVRVDASLKDDRGTDAEKLYAEAERIQKEYEQNMAFDENSIELPGKEPAKAGEPEPEADSYTGPSVLSYSLEGRKGSYLPIPAYKCIGSGEVTVIVTVDPNGNVVSAKVQDNISAADECLRQYALKAARGSRFSKKTDAPARQIGNIVYQFVAQ